MSPPGRSIPTAFYFIEQNTDTWCFCICCISPHPRGTLHPVVLLWAALRTSFHVVEGISLMMSHLYLNSSWSELLALLASSGECVLLAPTTCLLVCEVLPSSMCLGLIPGPVLTALLHRSWATSYTALHTLWALAAFSLQSWFQNQLQVRPLGPSLPAGSDMSSIMVLSTLPQCHAWERDHRTLHNIRTVTFECVLGLMTTSSYRPGHEREQHKHELGEHLFHCEPSMFRSENMWNGQRRLNDQL